MYFTVLLLHSRLNRSKLGACGADAVLDAAKLCLDGGDLDEVLSHECKTRERAFDTRRSCGRGLVVYPRGGTTPYPGGSAVACQQAR
jgi:hypothetical protein